MANTTNNPNLPPVTYAPRPPRLRKPPFWLIAIGLVSVVASWVPLVLFARARTMTSSAPRVQLMQDMGVQPKFSQQQSNATFADGRADRLPVAGTVARGADQLEADDHYYRGYTNDGRTADGKRKFKFFTDFPKKVKVDAALLTRGQERFNIYCSVCHGHDGHGGGAVQARAAELREKDAKDTPWTDVANLTAPTGPVQRSVGEIYNTINVGIRKMPPYGAQIPVEDRWAIVAYVRALQVMDNPPASLVATTRPSEK